MGVTKFKLLFGVGINPPLKSVIDYSVPESLEHPVDSKLKKVNKKVSKAKLSKTLLIPNDFQDTSTIAFSSSDFAVFQVEAITSVRILEDGSIHPDDWKFINANGTAFTFDTIKAYYSTFIGRMVYAEHDQTPDISSGFIIDAQVATKVDPDTSFSTASVQLLIAVFKNSSAYPILLKSGSLSYGGACSATVCTICGNSSVGVDDLCEHQARLAYSGGYSLPDGTPVAELFDGDSDFYEISAVAQPAYTGAIVHSYLDIPDNEIIECTIPTYVLSITPEYHGGVSHWINKGYIDLVQ